ncbi:heavy metal-responsive transcriptional regulator [Rickettsiella grylli]|uniref:Mercuric resistance operon regulatory protein n=1 Tax=Rickettsiella grylli TaxID=59196 RepID=A8PME1_9COXI|nr:heavy metal-responsive transcriptional regulator [Rickettsiella grylli]EDP45681.1 mercuric resistance operon regulatory protein [Rickettsiella grylli]
MKYYTIGNLAKLVQQTPVTIRYYEKIGLIPKSKRSEGGFRLYPESLLRRFYFIQNAKLIGFDLNEIKNLLDLEMNQSSSQPVKLEIQQKISQIENKIKSLQRIKHALMGWEQACDGNISIAECPILEALYHCPEDIREYLKKN